MTEQYRPNRATRRWNERQSHGGNEYTEYQRRHESVHLHVLGSVDAYNAIYTKGLSIADAVYQQGIQAIDLMDAALEHSALIDSGWRLIQNGKAPSEIADNLSHCSDNDNVSRDHKGVSLKTVSDMQSPLSREDRAKINKLFYVGPFRRASQAQNIATGILSNLAVESQLPRPKKKVSQRTQQMIENMRSYFDYWAEVFTNSAELHQNGYLESDFLRMFYSQNLIYTTIAYIPARLGISPSSTMELFEEFRELMSFGPKKTLKKNLRPHVVQVLEKSYLPNQVPGEILPYILPNVENSEQAAAYLEKKIQPPKTPDEGYELYQQRESAVRRFNVQLKPIILDQFKNRGLLDFVPQDTGYITRIQVAQQYQKAVIVSLHLQNGSHVTIDITDKNHVYGMPYRLRQKNPSIGDQVVLDAIEMVKKELEEVRKPSQKTHVTQNADTAVLERKISSQPFPTKKPERVPKRWVSNNSQPSSQEQKDTTELRQQSRVNFVAYDEELIRREIGKRATPATVDFISNALFRFSHGEKSARLLEFDNSHNTVRLRAGNFRIILQKIGDSEYRVVRIGDRKNVYDRTSI